LTRRRLWYIGRRAYDLTDWIALHPGGKDTLLQAEGTDCTELFRAYHLRGAPSSGLLARYEVAIDPADPEHVERMGGSHFTFDEGGFYRTLQGRVREHFRAAGRATHASGAGQMLAVALVVTAIGLTFPAYVRGSIVCALALGVLKAIAAIGPGHSMSHFSLFPRGRRGQGRRGRRPERGRRVVRATGGRREEQARGRATPCAHAPVRQGRAEGGGGFRRCR
jgi:hypothetical protein